MTLAQSFRSRGVLLSSVVYLVFSLACTRIPLVNYLGFEFSFATALVATLLAGLLSIERIQASYRRSDGESPAVIEETWTGFRETLKINLLLLVIPLAFMIANALVVKNCSLLEGLGFFLLIPVVTVLFACSLAFFCAVHYPLAKTAYILAVTVTIVYVLALGYWTPAIFSYNFFYGYFPGLTYDEILRLRWPLVIFRGVTVFVALALVAMARIIVRTTRPGDSVREKGAALLREILGRRYRLITVTVTAVLGLSYGYRCELGWESTSSYIQRLLGASVVTEHVTIYYDSLSFAPGEIRWVAAEHEFCLAQAWNAFVLPHRGQVTSYVYPSAEVKQRLIGAGVTNIAKPWSREVHLTRQTIDGTLKHELMHVIAGVFGIQIIRASLSPGLVEGLPMALEGEWGTRTLHEYAAAIRRAGIMPDVRRLMTVTGFAAQSSSVSYVLTGSFCRYLIDRFGIRKLAQVYGTGDFDKVYGRALDRLLADWQGYLERIPEQPGDTLMVDASFRRPPIFGKVCARVLANRNEQARTLAVSKDYQGAEKLFSASYADGGSLEALSGWLVSALRQKKYDVVTGVYDTLVAVAARPAEYLGLFLVIGDAFWAQGRESRAIALYDSVRLANLSRGFNEAANCRIHALENPHHEALLRFMFSDAHDSLRIRLLDSLCLTAPDDMFIRYLRGQTLFRLERYDAAVHTLETCDVHDPQLEASRQMSVGQALFRLRQFQQAKAAFWMSLNDSYSEGRRALVEEWIERCDWMTDHDGQ